MTSSASGLLYDELEHIATWTAALAHQCVVAVNPGEAAARVAKSWRDLAD